MRLTHEPPGRLHIYQLYHTEQGAVAVDLGFSNYFEPASQLQITKKTLVTYRRQANFFKVKRADAAQKDLFHYKAHVLRTVDGDTFWCLISLGFGFKTKQKLRLRGIDAPEIQSRSGLKAHTYLKRLLQPGMEILIRTKAADKYDRYLADVFLPKQSNLYLNQELLDRDHARLVSVA
jgi:endonuclease YncB( thermonuclease family)